MIVEYIPITKVLDRYIALHALDMVMSPKNLAPKETEDLVMRLFGWVCQDEPEDGYDLKIPLSFASHPVVDEVRARARGYIEIPSTDEDYKVWIAAIQLVRKAHLLANNTTTATASDQAQDATES